MPAYIVKVALILLASLGLSSQECRNTSDTKYDLSQPA